MKFMIRLILAIIVLAYPFVVYFGLLHFEFWQVSLFIFFIAITRLLLSHGGQSKALKIGFMGALVLLFLTTLSLVLQQEQWLKMYPMAISIILLYLFASSLWTDKCMIQRFAELREKNITPEKQQYMEKLTKIWCAFFIGNALISAFTVFYADDKYWMLYNGLISYLLMGTLGLGELLYRHLVVLRRIS